MAQALVVYGSTTGNTETTADMIASVLEDNGIAVEVKNVVDAKVDDLGGNYDLTLLGSSTWGMDEIEFQDDFGFFYNELERATQLKGKIVALFGCGDSGYMYYCGAVDKLEEMMAKLGANVVRDSLRIDGDPGDFAGEIRQWAGEVATAAK